MLVPRLTRVLGILLACLTLQACESPFSFLSAEAEKASSDSLMMVDGSEFGVTSGLAFDEEQRLMDRSKGTPEMRIAPTLATPLGGMPEPASEEALELYREAALRNRLLAREADLTLEVARVADAVKALEAMVVAADGYVSRRDNGRVVARIPAPRFEEMMGSVRDMGRVLSESVRALDVTEQHRDLDIRLKNARTARDRLLALLEKADKVEDILKIETELARLTTDVERLGAQLEELTKRVAFSTMTVRFEATVQADPEPTRRRPSRFRWIQRVGVESMWWEN